MDILKNDDGAVLETLTPGKIFGEESLLNCMPCKVSVRAKTHVDLLCLSPSGLQEVLAYYPSERTIIQRRAKDQMSQIPETLQPKNSAKQSDFPCLDI